MGAWWGMADNSWLKADSVELSNKVTDLSYGSDDQRAGIREALDTADKRDERG
jgi:hypothetical protein